MFQATLIGGQAQDEDIPPGPDDDQFNPNDFEFFGLGQPVHPGHGPPMPPPFNQFNPFAVPNPNQQNHQAMGWNHGPMQNNLQAQQNFGPLFEEEIPQLIPIQP
jgi:hypothetical protein